jgi:hypothetical protein
MRNTHSATATLEQRVLCLATLHAQPEPPDPGYQIFPLTFPMLVFTIAIRCMDASEALLHGPYTHVHTTLLRSKPLDHKSNDNESRTRCHSHPWLHTFMHDDTSITPLAQPTNYTYPFGDSAFPHVCKCCHTALNSSSVHTQTHLTWPENENAVR